MALVETFFEHCASLRGRLRSWQDRLVDWAKRTNARRIKRKSGAQTIVVTGSSAKTTTTMLLAHILAAKGKVRSLVQPVMVEDIISATAGIDTATEFFVAEISVGQKGHLRRMVRMLAPTVGLVTFIGIEHHKIYRKRENVAAEKAEAVKAVQPGGLVVLNADDPLVYDMRNLTDARVVTYGRDNAVADFRVISAKSAYPESLVLTIRWRGGETGIATDILGEHFWLSVAAAFATAIELGVDIETILHRIGTFKPKVDRCQLYRTNGGPTFILDTAKAPWQTLSLAIDVIKSARATSKRIVFGTISDYPGNPGPKYISAYRLCREAADQTIFVGPNSHRSKASRQDREEQRFAEFVTVRQVSDHLKATAGPQDLILLKSSRNLHLERIGLSWTHDVRCWKENCGLRMSCFSCGLFEYPFEHHEKIRALKKST